MNSNARVKITFSMEYECGSWGDDCTLGQLKHQVMKEARQAADRLREMASQHRIGLRIESFEGPLVIVPEPEKTS